MATRLLNTPCPFSRRIHSAIAARVPASITAEVTNQVIVHPRENSSDTFIRNPIVTRNRPVTIHDPSTRSHALRIEKWQSTS